MKSLDIRKGAFVGAIAAMVLGTVFAAPAKAAADDLITPNNSICEFAAASLGHGSQADPFQIGTSKQLAEVSDCSDREVTITNAVGNGTSITYTADNSFGVGQAISITGVNPSSFDKVDDAIRVTAASSTTFTVAGTVTDSYIDSGTAKDYSTFFSVVADINLATGNDVWNNVDSAVITNATGDGSTITYTGANTFEAGQEVVIKNVDPIEYSVGPATIVSATSTEFTVSGSASSSYVSGGEANSKGWLPLYSNRVTFNGNGHTISGLTIHRPESNIGLFGSIGRSTITNLNLTDVEVDASGNSRVDSTAGLTGYSDNMNYSKINVSGTVTGSNTSIGLLAGYARQSNLSDIETSGIVQVGQINSFNDGDNAPTQIGGVVGRQYGNVVNVHSSANVFGYRTNNVEASRTYAREVGGVVGDHEGTIRNSYATGQIYGGYEVGGLVGYTCCGDVANTYATGDVFANATNGGYSASYIGGLIGDYGCCGVIRDSYSTGDVTVVNNGTNSTSSIGGFLGSNDCCSSVINSYSTGDVTVTANSTNPAYEIGGFIGHHDCCNSISSSYSTGDVTVNNGSNVGGFIGAIQSENSIFDSYSTGDVTVSYDGDANVGGFIGRVEDDLFLERISASGNVTVTPFTEGGSAGYVGGLFGLVESGPIHITDSYFKGTVSGSDYVGGLFGWIYDVPTYFNNVYVSASVSALNEIAAVDPISNGYWTADTDTNMFDITAAGTSANSVNFAGKTTAELQTKATFTDLGWNFDSENGVWKIASDVNGGMPTLVGPQAVTDNGGGTTPEVVEKVVSLSSKNGVLSLSLATKFKVRTYSVNLPNSFAKKQIKVRVLRAGKVVKLLKTAKLNKGGNLTFISKYSLKKGDIVQARDAKKVRASVTIS